RTKDPVIREKVFGDKAEKVPGGDNETQGDGFFSLEMRTQLETFFDKMENPLMLKLCLDNRPVSKELQKYITTLVKMTDKLKLEIVTDNSDEFLPYVKLYRDDIYTGLAFHGVPGGHEFTSFVLGMYNAAGPGQAMDEIIRKRIKGIEKQVDIKILVSLSCTMCPDLVIATQHMAAIGEHITTEVYDIHHYESLKNKYKVMSVPCMVINDKHVYFGKKNIQQILEIVEEIVK
ncbi:MAG: thioredoxin family protein, partial [Lachnospiraceae bacterium]|nr:thioredoxin family protein [Lachnospiraceae bacterium]